jgi:hypothetical protein
MAAALRPGGRLVVSAPFWLVSPTCPTHLDSNRRLAGRWKRLYAPHDLQPIDGKLLWDPLVLQKGPHDVVPVGVPLRIDLGGLLLRMAGAWPFPFTLATKFALRSDPQAWPS